jgi:hypothetical protein
MAKKKPFLLTWWDDKTQAPAKEGCATYDRALIRKAQIERKTSNPVSIGVQA